MGAKHYTKIVDCWAVGCVLAELASLRPIFKGEEAELDSKKNVPFQRDQLLKIFEVLGTPDESDRPGVVHIPELQSMKRLDQCVFVAYNFGIKLMQYVTASRTTWSARFFNLFFSSFSFFFLFFGVDWAGWIFVLLSFLCV